MKKILPSDVITPILAYLRINADYKMILESIPRESEHSRFSIIAYNPIHEVKFENGILSFDNEVINEDPLEFLNRVTVNQTKLNDLPFLGGAIGFTAYDLISQYEKIGKIPADTIGTPDMHFFLYESFIVFDHKFEQLHVVEENFYSNRSDEEMLNSLDNVTKQLMTPSPDEFSDKEMKQLNFESSIEKEEFINMVSHAKDLIRQGDMFQCVLSQRFVSDFSGKPIDYYRNLRVTNPSNYLYFFDFKDYQVIGASPESLVSLRDSEVMTNPIAGTRPRGANPEEDAFLKEDLLNDIKEVAEHRMLVDLGRNDIGRFAKTGSVTVSKYMEVEPFRYVMHLTSVVKGQLAEGMTSLDALKATLPAGTVSGAPKIRAMRRIYELEKEKRGIYAGAIGYLSVTGDMDFAIAIRTMVIKNDKAYVQAGAGIVYDSVPEKEYEETIHKSKSMRMIGD